MKAWTTATLDDVCSLVTDGTHHSPPNVAGGEYRYVTAKNIRQWGLDLTDITYIDAQTHRRIYTRCPVEFEDVLYIKDGVTTGLAALNTLQEPFSMLSSVALLKPRREVLDPRYLKHWLNSPVAFASMTAGMTGTAIKRLVLRQIRAAEMPIAPLKEQHRIADKLDSVLARVDACRDRLTRIAPLLKRFRQSVLAAATSGRLTESWRNDRRRNASLLAGWTPSSIRAVTTDIRYGTSKKCAHGVEGLGVLRIPNIRADGSIDVTDLKRAAFSAREVEALSLRVGDLLVIRSNGSVDLIGRTAVVAEKDAGMLFAGYLIRLRVDAEKALPAYVHLCLSEPSQRARIQSTAKSTSGVNNINSEELLGLRLRLPPQLEQAEIIRRVEILFAFADRLEARLAHARTAVDRLTPSLLAKAFRGELVPKDSADEPAADLLKRLAAQRDDAPDRPRRQRATA